MINRSLKTAYFTLLKPAMRVSGFVYRHAFAPRAGVVKAHLGPGLSNYLPGWLNVDANFLTAKVDVWSDLRAALPFRDGTVDVFYSHHVIEHIDDHLLPRHFAEMFRCLKRGGIIRVGGPDGETAMRRYLEGDHAWFGDFPEKRASIGGRYANFILCQGEHLTILTPSYLAELAEGAGFRDVRRCAASTETHHPDLVGPDVLSRESEPTPEAPHTLLIEAVKPIS
jgi:SAM-dependent methyltransferase